MEVRFVKMIRGLGVGGSAPGREQEKEERKEGQRGRGVTKMVSELSTGGRTCGE